MNNDNYKIIDGIKEKEFMGYLHKIYNCPDGRLDFWVNEALKAIFDEELKYEAEFPINSC